MQQQFGQALLVDPPDVHRLAMVHAVAYIEAVLHGDEEPAVAALELEDA